MISPHYLQAQQARQAEQARHLEELAGSIRLLTLSHDGQTFHLSWVNYQDEAHTLVGRDLATLLILALGLPLPMKRCIGPCGRVLPLHKFSHYLESDDGRNRRCKACERARVRQHALRKRQEQRKPASGRFPGEPTRPIHSKPDRD